ncbi:MAG: hypothetical protein H7061_09805 [Bdellovibrionaceae bacterium]|nr:hypothetical protein [Bdellovibrio sp.]
MKIAFQMGIEIKAASGSILKPAQLQFWNLSSEGLPPQIKNQTPGSPFKYYTDAILGLCFHKMNDYKSLSPEHKQFAIQAYRSFDPYTELFQKSAPRVRALRGSTSNNLKFENFEKKMTEIWDEIFQNKVVNFVKLEKALDCLSEFEMAMESTFLYNFNVQFSAKMNEKLICFYSFLFHLRSLMAIDHNAHVEDSSLESVKCDSISDYLPKSDYTVNDALLYLQFKKLSVPFVGHKDKDPRIERLLVEPMLKSFTQYNHNACSLIDQLPKSFLSSLPTGDLEEALHHVQMDWLLGSEAGLLFKIREELFGATEGYDKIFWPELNAARKKAATSLSICFELSHKDFSKESAAA